MIRKDLQPAYNLAPETSYVDKEICVTGKIVQVQDLPQIVVYKKEQIKVTTK